MLIHHLLPGGIRWDSLFPLTASHKGQPGDRHVHAEKYQEKPCRCLSEVYRNLLDPGGHYRVDTLDPYHSRNSPEKAIQKIDPPAKVKWNLTVVPENFSKEHFCQNAAGILIGTAEECSHKEQEPVGILPVAVQQHRRRSQGHAPDDAERSPDKAAAAHPHARRHPAEDRLHDISEERADYQKQRDLVKAKAVGEYRLSLLSLRLELLPVYRLRVGVLDTAVHPAIDLPLEP